MDDFELQWLDKLGPALQKSVGEKVAAKILSTQTMENVAERTRALLAEISHLTQDQSQEVMLNCACQYLRAGLIPFRKMFRATGDLASAHRALQ